MVNDSSKDIQTPPTMILYIVFLITLAVYAYRQAWRDYLRISLGQPIDHGARLKERLWFAGVRWLICASLGVFVFNVYWLDALLWIPAGWATWTAMFRLSLNKMRGLHWNYISPSNVYDSVFLRITWGKFPDRTELVEAWHVYMCAKDSLRAGTLAYIFEALVFVAANVLMFFVPWK